MYPLRSRASELLSRGWTPRQADDDRSEELRGDDLQAGQGHDQPAQGEARPPPRPGADAAAGVEGGVAGAGETRAAPYRAGFRGANRPWLAILLPAGMALAALALAAMLPAEPAMLHQLPLAMAAALGMLALFQAWQWQRLRAGRSSLAEQIAQGFEHDPEALILSDAGGRRLAGNAAAGALTLEDALARFCAEPGRVVADMLAESLARGHAGRDFGAAAGGLRARVHCLQGSAPARTGHAVFAWRFSHEREAPAQRAVDMLGLPVLTLGPEGAPPRANAALQAFLARRETRGEAALDDLAGELRPLARAHRPASIIMPDGTTARLALPLPAADGQIDVMLLPAGLLPRADEAGMPEEPDFEDIPVALMHIAPDGRIRRSNRQARALLGLPVARKAYFSELVEGLGRPVEDWLDDAQAGRALNRPEVMRAVLPAQETFVQVILRRSPPPDDALVAVISDATELKSLEARFVQSQKMQAIGQLAGGVAHDFNNLLTAISGHCDLLLMNRDHYDPDYSDLMQIHQNANRAAALVRQLLAFSRKQTLKPEWLTLESLLEDLTHLLTRLVGERIAVSLHHDPRLRMIRTDRRQLEQVILNLVVNARDAMPMGGEIRIETEALTLAAELERARARLPAGHYAVIRVIDEGIGIPADILDKIFEPFFTTKKLGEGTGLGLSTAYGIVKQMGGYIFADSTEGTGTVFTLYLSTPEAGADCDADDAAAARAAPAQQGAQQGAAGARPAPAEAAGAADCGAAQGAGIGAGPGTRPGAEAVAAGARAGPGGAESGGAGIGGAGGGDAVVLLVEDEAPVRAFAARALRLHGYQVIEAESGEQALEFLGESALRVDVFVSDVVMPGIDGPGWVNEARAARPDVPVVFMSGHTQDSLHAALARTPGAAFLDKPFTLQALCQTIDRQLEAHRAPGFAPGF